MDVHRRNMENSAETSPLLNAYKKEYFFQRFSQTVFGGPLLKLSSDDDRCGIPIYVHFYQFVIFILPLLIASVFTSITESQSGVNYWMSVGFGLFMTIIVVIVHLIRNSVAKKTNPLESSNDYNEDDVDFEGCCGIKQVLRFVINKKKWTIEIVVHALLYGTVNGIMFLYLLPSTNSRLSAFQSTHASVCYFIISWITSCIGLYGLIARPPKEPCQFRSTDQYEIILFTRPFYMSLFGIIGILAMFNTSLGVLDLTMRVIFPCLPLLWTLGMLPPIDCLFAWLGEQLLVHLFGGSPMANNWRLFLMLALSCVCWLLVYAIANQTVALALAACFGVILSVDIPTLFEAVILRIFKKTRVQNVNRTKPTNAASLSCSKTLYFLLVLIATALISSLTNYFVQESEKKSLLDTSGYVIAALFIVQRILGNFLSAYVFFGLIKNPFFSSLKKSKGKRVVVLLRKVLIGCVIPLLLVAFVTLSAEKRNGSSTLSALSYSLFASRGYHFAWQNQHDCAFDVAIFMVIRHSSVTNASWWDLLQIHVQLFLVSLLRSRAQHFWNLASFAARFTYKFYFNRKVRHQSYRMVATISVIALPFLLVFFFLTAILSAPLLPVFTLPVFLMGYVRPKIFWPYADNEVHSSSKEWIYYRQLTPSFLHCLKDTISSGSLGEVSTGEHFLARFQDRIVWLVIAERGFMHSNVLVKGLELAETSCHTIEAGRVDDMFEYITGNTSRPLLNPYPGHCLLPCDLIELDTYSDARNVLTGIIDRPDNLKQLSKNFVKSLTWVLVRFSKSRRDRCQGDDGPTAEELKARFELKQKKHSVYTPATNETKETFVLQSDTIEDILRERSSSNISRSSLSENSMTALWSNRGGMKMKPITGRVEEEKKQVSREFQGMPAANTMQLNRAREHAENQSSFRGPNLVADDDFDDFSFDDVDYVLPRNDSFANDEFNAKHACDTVVDSSSFSDPFSHSKVRKRNTLPSLDIDVSSPHSSIVEPPLRWKQSVPVDASDISKAQDEFSEEWFKFVIARLGLEEKGDHVLKSISADRGLLFIFRKLVLACHFLVYEQQQHTTYDVWRLFSGVLPWSRYLSWLEHDAELQRNVLLAYRYAFKLMYDEAVLGPIEDFEETAEYLLDYETNWHMGNDDDEDWMNAVLSGVPNLLSIGYRKIDGTSTSRVLTKQKTVVPIGRLDSENVKAIWASLSLELLYFTNDDEERYSIQAHLSHLRNIVVQAADPPLGYPVYSSGLLNVIAW